MLKNVKLSGNNVFATIVGAVVLLVGASGVFNELQSSINYIWGLRPKPKRGLVKFLKNRLMSFSMIGSISFLLLVSLTVNTLLDIVSKRILAFLPDVTVYVFYVLNLLIVVATTTVLFSLVFRTLPDGKLPWKYTFIGSIFTAVFFLIGKFAIGAYLGNSKVASTYGAAGSVIVVLVWVYYSAIILYAGAEFTKAYTRHHGHDITPYSYAVEIDKRQPEKQA
jgi:membrane protein